MPKATDTRKPFNLLLSPDEYDMLQALRNQSGASAGAELRAALRARYTHIICLAPSCADGHPCFVPQMHRSASPAPAPVPHRGYPGAAPQPNGYPHGQE